MKVNQRTLLSCAVSSVLGFSASAALAQEGTGRSTSVLEEIIVTAQKRSESLQDVPVAVSAFTSETRDLIGITTIGDLTDFTPGLSYATTLDRMSLRGVGRLTNNYGSDPGIATYSDGFYTASNVEAGKRPMHTERIEVLRGPQGTLYGRNSIGGALNIISKRPTDTWQGEVRAVAGNYDTQIFDGSISGPITDWLRFKASGSTGGQGDGFLPRRSDGDRPKATSATTCTSKASSNSTSARASKAGSSTRTRSGTRSAARSCRSRPTTSRRVYFGGLFPNTTFNGPQTTPRRRCSTAASRRCCSLSGDRFVPTSPSLSDPRIFDTDTPFRDQPRQRAHLHARAHLAHGLRGREVRRRLPGLHVPAGLRLRHRLARSVHGARRRHSEPGVPARSRIVAAGVFTIQPHVQAFYQEDKEYYSNEINLISNGDGPFQWILGLYQYHEQVFQPPACACRSRPSSTAAHLRDLARPARTAESRPDPAERRRVSRRGCARSVRRRSITLHRPLEDDARRALHRGQQGRRRISHARAVRLRHPHPRRCLLAGLWSALPSRSTARSTGAIHLSGDWHATTGTAGLEWTPNDDTLAFVKYTRGYKSGGFNAGHSRPAAPATPIRSSSTRTSWA